MHALDEFSPSPALRFDRSGVVTHANRAAAAALGVVNGVTLLSDIVGDVRFIDLRACVENAECYNFCAHLRERPYHCVIQGNATEGCGHLYAHDIIAYQSFVSEWQRLVTDYDRQLKELSCIYALAESIRSTESIEDVCGDLVHLIPQVWQFPELACARILLDDRPFTSGEFVTTEYGQSAAIIASGRARGMVQVYYSKQPQSQKPGGAFLPSERKLLDAVARTLGEALERRDAEAQSREREQTLARERHQFETILRSIGDGVVVTDIADRIVLMNKAALELLGGSEREQVGAHFLDLIHDESFAQTWQRANLEAKDIVKQDLHVESPTVKTLTATRTRTPDKGSGVWNVTILHDVTREREIEQMKSDFVSAISHELRTPMTSIKGFTSTLLRKPDMDLELRTHFLTIVEQESDRLMSLIEELLLIARIESAQLLLEREQIDIPQLIENVVFTLQPAMQAKQQRFIRAVDEEIPKPSGDVKKIRMIIFNLLHNAIKYTPEGGEIQIVASASEPGWLRIVVEDTGLGIPDHDREHIWDRFYQVHRNGQLNEGAGLGLFVVREMVRLHGGRVSVDSELGKGSRFTVDLPIEAPIESASSPQHAGLSS